MSRFGATKEVISRKRGTLWVRAAPGLPRASLSKRAIEVLQTMVRDADATTSDDCYSDGDLIYEEGAGWWLGTDRIHPITVRALIIACAISVEDGSDLGRYERWTINGTGRAVVAFCATDAHGGGNR